MTMTVLEHGVVDSASVQTGNMISSVPTSGSGHHTGTKLAPGLTFANICTISPANIWQPGNWRLNRGQGKN